MKNKMCSILLALVLLVSAAFPVTNALAAEECEPVEVPVEAVVEVPVEAAVEEPVEVPVEAVVEEPVEVPVEEPAEEPIEESVEEPAEEPIEESVEEPAEVQTAETGEQTASSEGEMPAAAQGVEAVSEDSASGEMIDTAEEEAVEEASEEPADEEEEEVFYSYTNVGPFLAPVYVSSGMALMAMSRDGAGDDGELKLAKTVSEPDESGTYTITLEAYATGTVTVNEQTTAMPCDIVLVLDMSSSMEDERLGTVSRLAALKAAASAFAEDVAAKAAEGVSHRIAVVTFNSGAVIQCGLQDMRQSNHVSGIIQSLSTSTGTVPGDGLAAAATVFGDYAGNDPVTGGDRQRVVVFFTDGYPSTTGSDKFTESLANNAIAAANTLKQTYKATVYSVAVLSGADPTASIAGYGSASSNTLKVNRYLHFVSSNYPNAQNLSSGGSGGNNGYYLTAGNTSALNNIFTQISSQIEVGSTPVTLDETAVLRDVLSPYFALPEGAQEIGITASIVDYAGNGAWADNGTALNADCITVSEDGTIISVSGFDFAGNFVYDNASAETAYGGKKLVVTIPIAVRDGFLGGNSVPTNGAQSGIYTSADGSIAEAFPIPTVDVPIRGELTVTAADVSVYLTAVAEQSDVLTRASADIGGITLDLSSTAVNYGLADWQTDYVDIRAQAAVSALPLTADDEYTLTLTVAPKYTGAAEKKTAEDTAAVNVFAPVLSWADSDVWYADDAPTDFSLNLAETAWVHQGVRDSDADMTGTAPTLLYTYTPEVGAISGGVIAVKRDIPVTVAVAVGQTDITALTTFEHMDCNPACGYDEGEGQFLLHVNTCRLTVTKSGGSARESYVFSVYRNGVFYTALSIEGNGSKTICELPVGNYTIREDTGWSWRYAPVYGTAAVLSAGDDEAALTCANVQREEYTCWLNGYSAVVKNVYRAGREV